MTTPLAESIRPKKLKEVVGHEHLQEILGQLIDKGKPLSILLWGPPGSGKTTLARIYAHSFPYQFFFLKCHSIRLQRIKKDHSNH